MGRARIQGAAGLDPQSVEAESLATHNLDTLRQNYGGEWAFNHADPEAPPQLCVALSGGGKRSAAFSMGILGALHEQGVLEQVDVLSGVSGGSYTLSWYYLQQYYAQQLSRETGTERDLSEVRDAVFCRTGHYQRFLEQNARRLGRSMWRVGVGGVLLLPSLPFDWALRLTRLATSLLPPGNIKLVIGYPRSLIARVYGDSLAKTFFEVPDAKTLKPIELADQRVSREVGMLEMGEFARAKRLPLPLILAAAGLDNSLASELSNAIFELSPVRSGSDAFGYVDVRERPDALSLRFDEAAAVSGAAVGSSYPTLSWILDFLQLNLRRSIKNFGQDIDYADTVWEPGWWIRDATDPFIQLTDGGHVENLGAFPLIRRGCGTIIIVDAGHDPDMRFSSYSDLGSAVKQELNLSLSVCKIDRYLGSTATECDPMMKPVMKGSFSPLPVTGRVAAQNDILFVKLMMEEGRRYPPTVMRYHEENEDFPQESTWDQWFPAEQFAAYRDLGRQIIADSPVAEETLARFVGRRPDSSQCFMDPAEAAVVPGVAP